MQTPTATTLDTEFRRGLGLYDSTMVVVGSMIGSGIFIVSADMARTLGSPGWLLVAWLVAGVLTVVGALSYGELAAMMPRAGGQYVYLREAFSPLWGFLYGWTLFMVIQTGTIAAVAVAFARFLGVLVPGIAEDQYLVAPIHLSAGYAVSLSTAQLVGVLLIALLTWTNTRGLEYGRIVQNVFTTAKVGALAALIVAGLLIGRNAAAVADNFGQLWTIRSATDIVPGLSAVSAFAVVRVVGTTEDLAAIAREVGGDRVDVTALAKGYQDPHFVEPKPSFILAVSRADLLIVVGRELEIGWLPTLITSSRNAKIQPGAPGYLDASLNVKILEIPTGQITRAMGDVHPQGNPHYWLDPANGRRIAQAIRDRLSQLAPADKGYFASKYDDFDKRLAAGTRAA